MTDLYRDKVSCDKADPFRHDDREPPVIHVTATVRIVGHYDDEAVDIVAEHLEKIGSVIGLVDAEVIQ